MKIIAWNKETDTAEHPERVPNDGEWARFTAGNSVVKKQFVTPQTAPPKPPTVITKRAFSRRLNPVIREALRNTSDETAIDIREDLNFASHVDLSNPDLAQGLSYLVYAGFMTQAESDYVLNTPVTASEI